MKKGNSIVSCAILIIFHSTFRLTLTGDFQMVQKFKFKPAFTTSSDERDAILIPQSVCEFKTNLLS